MRNPSLSSRDISMSDFMVDDSASKTHFLPMKTAQRAKSLIALSDEQCELLEKTLWTAQVEEQDLQLHQQCDQEEDLVEFDRAMRHKVLLVLRKNAQWPGDDTTVDTVCDCIARFGQPKQSRRDDGEGCFRWVFRFESVGEIGKCRREIKRLFPQAFCWRTRAESNETNLRRRRSSMSMMLVLPQANSDRNDDSVTVDAVYAEDHHEPQAECEPMAFAAVICRVDTMQHDAMEYEFFSV